jgi:nitrogen fixation NifU-like protein
MDMYADVILDYYKNPRNYGTIQNPDTQARDVNPLCGDEIGIYLKITNNKISEIKFTGRGCAISQSSASMLTELVINKSLNDIKKLTSDDVKEMLGIELSHVRIKCAMLGLKVLKLSVYQYLGEKMSED